MPNSMQIKSLIRQVRERQNDNTATIYKNGMMSAADKVKLDAIRFDFERGTLSVVTDNVTLTFAAIKEETL